MKDLFSRSDRYSDEELAHYKMLANRTDRLSTVDEVIKSFEIDDTPIKFPFAVPFLLREDNHAK